MQFESVNNTRFSHLTYQQKSKFAAVSTHIDARTFCLTDIVGDELPHFWFSFLYSRAIKEKSSDKTNEGRPLKSVCPLSYRGCQAFSRNHSVTLGCDPQGATTFHFIDSRQSA